MLTDFTYSATKYPKSDSKIRYGSSNCKRQSKSTTSKGNNKQTLSYLFKDTSRRYNMLNPEDVNKKTQAKYHRTDYGPPKVSTKSITILFSLVSVIAIALLCNINVEVEENFECWEEFKKLNCDILNPKGRECIELFNCIGEPEYQIGLAPIIFSIISIFTGYRLNKQIKKYATKGLELWEQLISNSQQEKRKEEY